MIKKQIIRILAITSAIIFTLTASYYVKASRILLPGPLSAYSKGDEASGGAISHAELENDCGNCHAPVHCLAEELCTECHLEVANQRLAVEGLHGRLPVSRCQTCHTEHKGRDALITEFAFSNIDHESLAQFSLVKHQHNFDGSPMHCTDCHSQAKRAEYLRASLDCLMCHQSENPAYISGHLQEFGQNCVGCHDGNDRMSAFDHTDFYPLEGEHQAMACLDCHLNQVFEGTSHECSGCHTEPDIHLGEFGTDCRRCHMAAAWVPAQLTQHEFHLDHGSDQKRDCLECHPETYVGYSCTTCHDHSPEQIVEVHKPYEIENIDDCAFCHPTGIKGEAENARWDPPANDNPIKNNAEPTVISPSQQDDKKNSDPGQNKPDR